VPRGRGMSKMMNIRKGLISGMLLVNVYAMDFFKLSKIRRPEERKNHLAAKHYSLFTTKLLFQATKSNNVQSSSKLNCMTM